MDIPIIQILLKERLLQELPFRGEQLRVGRMKENDIVINNLAVSRFHATLHRAGDGVELEDLGSENGCYLNGAPVRGRVALQPGDAVRIGKHTLVWRRGEADGVAAQAPHGQSDAWDAAQTYFAGAPPDPNADLPAAVGDAPSDTTASAPTAPPVDAGPAESGPPTDLEIPGLEPMDAELDLAAEGAELDLGGPDSDIDPVAEGLDLGDGDDLDLAGPDAVDGPLADGDAADGLEDDALERVLDAAADEAGPVTRSDEDSGRALFDFDGAADAAAELSGPEGPGSGAGTQPEQASADRPGEEAAADAPLEAPTGLDAEVPYAAGGSGAARLVPGRYPGLILQRNGRLDRIVPWEDEELAVGRGTECQVVLGSPEVSRRHAVFAREGEHFVVRDQGSANGLFVNGVAARERMLEVGDVIAIDEWQLTFVLDHEPIQNEVLTGASNDAPDPDADPDALTLVGASPAADDETDGDGGEAPTVEMTGSDTDAPELDLLAEPEDDEEKELSVRVTGGGRAAPVELGRASPLCIELELMPEELPAPLRALVDALEGGEISVPVRLRLRAGRR